MLVSWADIKNLINTNQGRLNYIERANEYVVIASNTSVSFECAIEKGTADATEFEVDYVPIYTNLVEPIDSDGSRIARTKTTRSGWHYEPRAIDFITGTAGSLYNRKHTGNTIATCTDYNDCTLKFFDENGLELTQGQGETVNAYQARLDSYCVTSQIDWQPQYDMDIIGATMSVLNPPVAPAKAYCWFVVAPDIPANQGGQIPFLGGGLNLRFFTLEHNMQFDGRGIKTFAYDPVYNSNKIRVIIKHTVGLKTELQFLAEHFKE